MQRCGDAVGGRRGREAIDSAAGTLDSTGTDGSRELLAADIRTQLCPRGDAVRSLVEKILYVHGRAVCL
jgi:hypothetical protein